MDRRGFLSSILALGAAPAIVRADSLMRIVPREAVVKTYRTNKVFLFDDRLISVRLNGIDYLVPVVR